VAIAYKEHCGIQEGVGIYTHFGQSRIFYCGAQLVMSS